MAQIFFPEFRDFEAEKQKVKSFLQRHFFRLHFYESVIWYKKNGIRLISPPPNKKRTATRHHNGEIT
jgi:hypothetical protein